MSSSSAIPSANFWDGTAGFRDASDYTLFKKRKGIKEQRLVRSNSSILQSLQNKTSLAFGFLNCNNGCRIQGGYPIDYRLTSANPI